MRRGTHSAFPIAQLPNYSITQSFFMIVRMPSARKKSAKSLVKVTACLAVFRGPVFSVASDELKEPGGIRVRRDVVRHSGSIAVLAVDDSGRPARVLLERQYRYAAGARLWELPAGRVDAGESNLAAAKRELLEATGFTAAKWQRALCLYVSPGL